MRKLTPMAGTGALPNVGYKTAYGGTVLGAGVLLPYSTDIPLCLELQYVYQGTSL